MAEWSDLLSELVASRGSELNRYGFLLCGDREEACDLVQEALVRVFTHPRASWTVGDVEGYVRRTMLNRFLDLHRRRMRLAQLLPRVVHPASAPDHAGASGSRLDLMSALDALSPRQRACVVLRYFEDLQVADIADRLGASPGTVKRHLSDGLARLNAVLDRPRSTPIGGRQL